MRKRKTPKYFVDFIRLINDGDDGIMEFRPPVNTNFLAVALLIQLINCIRRPNGSFKVYIGVFYDYIDYDKIKHVSRYKPLNLIIKEYTGYLIISVLIAFLTIILICSGFDIRVF